jgi:hypothetical protein
MSVEADLKVYCRAYVATLYDGVWIVNWVYWIPIQYTQSQCIHFATHTTTESLTESLLWTLLLIQLRAQFCNHRNHSYGITFHH